MLTRFSLYGQPMQRRLQIYPATSLNAHSQTHVPLSGEQTLDKTLRNKCLFLQWTACSQKKGKTLSVVQESTRRPQISDNFLKRKKKNLIFFSGFTRMSTVNPLLEETVLKGVKSAFNPLQNMAQSFHNSML